MILVFGGTTEGKITSDLLTRIGEEHLYATKTRVKQVIEAEMLVGALDNLEMQKTCKQRGVKLIIDAAHPFAEVLHRTIYQVSQELDIPVLRFNREYPDLSTLKGLRLFSSFEEMNTALENEDKKNVLALTGVQTINHFKSVWDSQNIYFRILDTPLSYKKGIATGIDESRLLPAPAKIQKEGLRNLIKTHNAQILLTKESGGSGYFNEKYELSQEYDIPLWVIKLPVQQNFKYCVNTAKDLLKIIYKLKQNLLKKGVELRSGYTTGTCVTASASAALYALFLGSFANSSHVILPLGQEMDILVFGGELNSNFASCSVIKDAGDDPDVIHAKEVGCKLELVDKQGIQFCKGHGVGLVTLSGLQVPVGQPAINPVPRQMITDALTRIAKEFDYQGGFIVTPFIPEGEELGLKTFNPRIGVMGGLSILGTTGIVKPLSAEAYLNSIRRYIEVAYGNGVRELILTSGKRSENILKPSYPHLDVLSYIHYGNFVGETLKICAEEKMTKIALGIMLGKAIKLAEGNLDTHSKHNNFNAQYAADLAISCNYSEDIVSQILELKLANAIVDLIPFATDEAFYVEIAKRAKLVCESVLPSEVDFTFLLIGKDLSIISV